MRDVKIMEVLRWRNKESWKRVYNKARRRINLEEIKRNKMWSDPPQQMGPRNSRN